jgi:hypothetical protein
MRALLLISGLFMAAFASSPATAGFQSGNDLYGICKNADVSAPWVCLGYAEGAFDAYSSWGMYCAPNGVEAGQVRDVLTRYLENHPENRQNAAAELSIRAFSQAWPCPKPPSKKP